MRGNLGLCLGRQLRTAHALAESNVGEEQVEIGGRPQLKQCLFGACGRADFASERIPEKIRTTLRTSASSSTAALSVGSGVNIV